MVRQHDCCKWPFHPGGNETQKIYQVAGLMTWFGICLTYIRFYQGLKVPGLRPKQNAVRSQIPTFPSMVRHDRLSRYLLVEFQVFFDVCVHVSCHP